MDLGFSCFNLLLLSSFVALSGDAYAGRSGSVGIVCSWATFLSLMVMWVVKQCGELAVLLGSVERC